MAEERIDVSEAITRSSHNTGPQSRLQRICDAMLEAARAHPEYRAGDQIIAITEVDADHIGQDTEHGDSAMGVANFSPPDAIASLVASAQAVANIYKSDGRLLRIEVVGSDE